MVSRKHRNRCLSPPGNLEKRKPQLSLTFGTNQHSSDNIMRWRLRVSVPVCVSLATFEDRFQIKKQMALMPWGQTTSPQFGVKFRKVDMVICVCVCAWTQPVSYQELGQHILCTALGCSTVHRLQPKHKHTLTLVHFLPVFLLFEATTVTFLCSIIDVTLTQLTVSVRPTRHVHHATVAVVHQVACFTVDATGCDAVTVKEVWVHGRHLTVSPGRGKIYQLPWQHITLLIIWENLVIFTVGLERMDFWQLCLKTA